MKAVYLAGAIMGRSNEECVDWREYVKQLLKCRTIDPMVRDYRGREPEEFVAIVEKDKTDIDNCDILLVNYVEPSVGTSMEILYAWERGKLVVLVASSGQELSPWLLYHHHKLFFTLEDAASHINAQILSESHAMEAPQNQLLMQAK
jgi:nucleoside 2-deoxyribosyltransferase